ncbi:MAG: hypothetical protein FWH26_07560 [Oscillospiraceae bacterium]|nr:hypothetical protein [Oscillospiraceae bacterium]
MASIDMKLKDLMKDPAAVEVLEKNFPGFTKNPQLKMGYPMTFRTIARFPQAVQMGLTAEVLAKIDADLKAL